MVGGGGGGDDDNDDDDTVLCRVPASTAVLRVEFSLSAVMKCLSVCCTCGVSQCTAVTAGQLYSCDSRSAVQQ
jgi:hypothetical protein